MPHSLDDFKAFTAYMLDGTKVDEPCTFRDMIECVWNPNSDLKNTERTVINIGTAEGLGYHLGNFLEKGFLKMLTPDYDKFVDQLIAKYRQVGPTKQY